MPNGLQFLTLNRPDPSLPLLIFLPGMDGTALSLQHQRPRLQGRFDLRCFSVPVNDSSSWNILISKVLDYVKTERQRHHQRPVYLCGESFGGCLALQVVARAPSLFAGLVIINSASSFNRQFWQGWIASVVRQMSESVYRTAANVLLPWLIDRERAIANSREALLQAIQSVTPESAAWRLSLLCEAQVEGPTLERSLQQFPGQTLLIASGRDQLLPSLDEARRLAPYFKDAQVVTLSDSSHACLLETDVDLTYIFKQTAFLPDKS